MATEARAFQRETRQSPYKMRLVIDQIRGLRVNEALALLMFSKKLAAKQIEKVLKSAVANAEVRAREAGESMDTDDLFVTHAVINEGRKLKRFMPAAMGRATPIHKRTSHVEIVVGEREGGRKPAARKATARGAAKGAAKGDTKTGAKTQSAGAQKTQTKKER
jgi:large subunit ribosomal protein L22